MVKLWATPNVGIILCIVDVGHWFGVVGSPCISSPNRVCVCVSVCPCVCVGIQHWRWASRVANLPEHCWVRRKKVHTREKNWCLVFTNFPYFHDKYSYYFYCSQPLIFSPRAVNLSRPRELFHGTLLFSSFIPFLRPFLAGMNVLLILVALRFRVCPDKIRENEGVIA